MNKRKLKKVINVIMLCILTLNLSTLNIYAENLKDLGNVVDGSMLTNQKNAEKIETSIMRGNILNQGIAQITNLENGKVNVYGAATCHVTCDKVTISMTLQRYSGGYWQNVTTYDYSANNTATLSRSNDVAVSKGYYYRVKGLCTAKKGNTIETKTPTTDGIWIN